MQLGISDVYKHLAFYLDDNSERHTHQDTDVLAFANYFCEKVGVQLLAETGIIFTTNRLHHDRLILRHVLTEKYKVVFSGEVTEEEPLSVEAKIRRDICTNSLQQEKESRKRLTMNDGNDSMELHCKRRAKLDTTINDNDGDEPDGNGEVGSSSSSSSFCRVKVEVYKSNTSSTQGEHINNVHVEEKMMSSRVNYHAQEVDFLDFYKFCVPNATPLVHCGDHNSVGRWGEALVYNFLLFTRPEVEVKWMNVDEESNAYYDMVMTIPSGMKKKHQNLQSTRFIEVKTTRFRDKNVFQISPWEYEFLCNHPRPKYDIYRVYGAPIQPRIVIYEDVYQLIQEKKISLCLAV